MSIIKNLTKHSDLYYTAIVDEKTTIFVEDKQIGGFTVWFADYEHILAEGSTIEDSATRLLDLFNSIPNEYKRQNTEH